MVIFLALEELVTASHFGLKRLFHDAILNICDLQLPA